MSDHPLGAVSYHWCALLCAFGEAALEHGLLSPWELEPIRQDIEASLPGLRACRQVLVVVPASLWRNNRLSWTCSAMARRWGSPAARSPGVW